MADQDHTDDDEVDEQFLSLLEGIRTSLPGVQVLFAFLLTAPLQAGFADLDASDRRVFTTAFVSSGLASILLIAPSVHQRVRAPITGMRRRSKGHLTIAIWLATIGSVIMAIALGAALFLVSGLVLGNNLALIVTTAVVLVMLWAWFYLPLVTFRRSA